MSNSDVFVLKRCWCCCILGIVRCDAFCSETVRGSYSARVSTSSLARVRRVLVLHIVEEEGEDQEDEKDGRREDEQQPHHERMEMGWSEMCAARQT